MERQNGDCRGRDLFERLRGLVERGRESNDILVGTVSVKIQK